MVEHLFEFFLLTPNLPLDKFDQKILGTIKSSNLCTSEYSALALPTFVTDERYNLNCIMDVNYFLKLVELPPLPHRVGIQGLADTFMPFRMPFDSSGSKQLDIPIFEIIYHAALEASSDGEGPYETWVGSPA